MKVHEKRSRLISNKIDRLFKFGFFIAKSCDNPDFSDPTISNILDRFENHRIGSYTILIEKSCPYFLTEINGTTFAIIGEFFDNDGDDPKERIRELAKGDIVENLSAMDLGGRYALLMISGDDLLVANDPFGSRAVHFIEGGRVAVSSHEALLAQFYGLPRNSEVLQFRASSQFKERTVSYLPGNICQHSDIRRLPSNHLYNSKSSCIERYWPRLPPQKTTEEDVFSAFERALTALRSHVAERYTPVLSITGGVDSRSIVSTFHESGTRFIGVTWVDVNFNLAEQPVIDQITSLTGCFHFNIGKDNYPEKVFQETGALNAGGSVSGLRAKLMEGVRLHIASQQDENTNPLFVIGYGGEILRGFYRKKHRHPDKVFDAHSMAGLYGIPSTQSANDQVYIAYVNRAFGQFFRDAQFDSGSLKGFDPHDIFYWEHRMAMWAALTMDTIDVAMPCLVGINSRRLYEAALSLPVEARLAGNLIQRYTQSRSPALGRIPVK